MMKKRLFAALLAACLTLPLLFISALAAEDTPGPTAPEYVWRVPGPIQGYYSASPFAPSDHNSRADVSFSKLNNLVWLGFTLQDEFQLPFTDVPEDSWFYPGVRYVYVNSLMGGTTESTFSPFEPVTRGMAWTVLARMNGANPTPASGEAWYEPGKAWAVEHGVTDGANPLGTVTREQWVSMLWRRAGYPQTDIDLSVYSDGASVSGYAQDAVRWAISIGVIQGTGGTLSPQSPLNRAELASMILRLVPKRR